MELIPSSNTTLTTHTPKIIETPNNLIINSQHYNKATLQPIPMKFTSWGCQYKHLFLKTRIDWNNEIHRYYNIISCHRVNNTPYIWISKDNPNRFYSLADHSSYRTDCDDKVLRYLEEQDDKINFLQAAVCYNNYGINQTSDSNYRAKNDLNILCETNTYFIAARKTQHFSRGYNSENPKYYYGLNTIQLLRINKTNLTSYTIVQESYTDYGGNTSPDYENNFTIAGNYYYLESKPNSEIVYLAKRWKSNIQILKYDATTNILTGLYTYTNNYYRTMSNAIKVGDYYYALIDNYIAGAAIEHTYAFIKIKLDINTDKVIGEVIPIDNGPYTTMVTRNYSLSVVNSLETFSVNGKDYITCTMFATDFELNAENHFHATIRLDDTQGTVTDYIPLNMGCRGVLNYVEPTTCVFLLYNSFAFYAFDSTAEKFVLTYNSPGIYKTIGFDMMNRFYALSTAYSVEMLTYYSPVILKADFEEEIYNKVSDKVETKIYFYAKNFSNEFINTNVTIKLIGGAIFKDNGKTTIETNTADTGIKELPVTITGNGRIQVTITQTT